MKKSIIVLLMVIVAVSLFVGCKNGPEAKTYKVGDTIDVGSKGDNAVTWLILAIDEEDNTALLISKDILENRQFDSSTSFYSSSAIHRYLLSDEFFNTYGLSKDYMLKVDVTTAIETTTISESGSDCVFLLSKTEYGKYKKTIATAGNSTVWWLRTPSSTSTDTHVAWYVQTNGTETSDNVNVSRGIRPAFWCKLSEINN